MVEVTVEGGDATAGEDTNRCSGLDLSFQPGVGSSSGGPVADHRPVLTGDGVPPFGLGLFFDDLAGDVGDDRPPPRYLPWLVVEVEKCGQPDLNVNDPPVISALLTSPGEQVQEDVGSDLIDRPLVSCLFQLMGYPVSRRAAAWVSSGGS